MHIAVRPPRRKPEGLLLALNRSGKSLTQIAEETGKAPSNLSLVFNGRVRPRQKTLDAVAKALGVSSASLGIEPYPDPVPRAPRTVTHADDATTGGPAQ